MPKAGTTALPWTRLVRVKEVEWLDSMADVFLSDHAYSLFEKYFQTSTISNTNETAIEIDKAIR